MQYSFPSNIQAFVDFQIATGKFATADDVLLDALELQWEAAEPSGDKIDDWPAIKEALDGIENGTNKPVDFDDAFNDVRLKYGYDVRAKS